MADFENRTVGHTIGKVAGSRGQFGRSDDWAVLRLVKTYFGDKTNGFPPSRIIVSYHNSKAAAQRALSRIT